MKSKKIKNFNIYDLVYSQIYLLPLLICVGYVVFNIKSLNSYTDIINCLLDLLVTSNNIIASSLVDLVSNICDTNDLITIVCYLFSYMFIVEIVRLGFDFITFIFKFVRSCFDRWC